MERHHSRVIDRRTIHRAVETRVPANNLAILQIQNSPKAFHDRDLTRNQQRGSRNARQRTNFALALNHRTTSVVHALSAETIVFSWSCNDLIPSLELAKFCEIAIPEI